MKVKMFKTTKNVFSLEDEINEFLNNDKIEIKEIKQSMNGSLYGGFFIISIWYIEIDK